MNRALPATIALLVLLAGCTTLTSEATTSPHDVSISITNNHDVRYVVTVAALPPDADGIEIVYENGSSRRFDASSLDALPQSARRNATAITAIGDDRLADAFEVGPNRGIGTTLEAVPPGSTVVYHVLSSEKPRSVRGAGVARCGADTAPKTLEVTIRPDGSIQSATACTEESSTPG